MAPHSSTLAWKIPWMEVRDIVQETGIKIASPGSMHDTACSGLVHWDDPEGWYREGGGSGGFRMGNTCTPVADSC